MLFGLVPLMAAGPAPAEADNQILARFRAGDEEAFFELYSRYAPAVLGVLNRVLRDRGGAEDLLQEVFLTLWERRAEFDARAASALPWLLVVARHRALDRLRSAAHRHEARAAGSEALAYLALPDPRAVFEPAIWRALDMERARAAMALLTTPERQALELAFFEGLTHAEVSARLGQPLGTVKTWIRNGLGKMRQALAKDPS